MGYHDGETTDAVGGLEPLSLAQQVLAVGVRLVGVAVLLLGVWVGVKVILEAWALYQEPVRIERFADAIEQGSNLDGLLGSLAAGGDASGAAEATAAQRAGLRLSYFAAWLIVLLLMFVVGSLAMSAIATGGQLALFDLAVRRHSRAVIREVRRLHRGAA